MLLSQDVSDSHVSCFLHSKTASSFDWPLHWRKITDLTSVIFVNENKTITRITTKMILRMRTESRIALTVTTSMEIMVEVIEPLKHRNPLTDCKTEVKNHTKITMVSAVYILIVCCVHYCIYGPMWGIFTCIQ